MIRRCCQCGTIFAPRREHVRFCSPRCRVGWNRDHSTDAAAEERALEWSLTGMRQAIGRLTADRPAAQPDAPGVIAEAVWWVTIIDARLIRQYLGIYDAVLAIHGSSRRPMIEGTLAGLRFVRNQMSEDLREAGFIESPEPAEECDSVLGTWQWAHLTEPDLPPSPAHGQPWELTRYQAYEQWLARTSVGLVFQRAAGFLKLAASRARAGQTRVPILEPFARDR